MTTATLVLAAAGLAGAMLLLAGGVHHLRDRRRFAAVLTVQRVVPRPLRRAVAAGTGTMETVVGASTIAAWLASPRLAVAAFTATGVVYACLGVYSAVVRYRAPTAPCGCLGGSGSTTRLVIGRAWILAVSAGAAAVLLSSGTTPDAPSRLWCVMPAVLIALTGWLVPELFAALSRAPRPAGPPSAGGAAFGRPRSSTSTVDAVFGRPQSPPPAGDAAFGRPASPPSAEGMISGRPRG